MFEQLDWSEKSLFFIAIKTKCEKWSKCGLLLLQYCDRKKIFDFDWHAMSTKMPATEVQDMKHSNIEKNGYPMPTFYRYCRFRLAFSRSWNDLHSGAPNEKLFLARN